MMIEVEAIDVSALFDDRNVLLATIVSMSLPVKFRPQP